VNSQINDVLVSVDELIHFI